MSDGRVQNIAVESVAGGIIGNLKRVGRQLVGPCPFCGGTDRFWIDTYKNVWGCRHCNTKDGNYIGSDALAFVARLHNLDLHTRDGYLMGLALLGLEPMPSSARPPAKVSKTAEPPPVTMGILGEYAADTEPWQSEARRFVSRCYATLRGESGAKAWEYLTEKRGLAEAVLNSAEIGFNAEPYNARWGDVDVYAPRGVVIPWAHGDGYHRIRVRTSDPAKKYAQVAGGRNGLYMPWTPAGEWWGILTEGEFDALSVRTAAYARVAATSSAGAYRLIPIATGGTTQGRVLRHVGLLATAQRILVAFDDDQNGAGESAAGYWLNALPNARRAVPIRHDVNDMLVSGDDVLAWARGLM